MTYFTRAQWGSAHEADYAKANHIGPVERLVIHHTGSSQPVSPEASPGFMRQMESYGGSNRWIEYHGIVDQYGQSFQGWNVRTQGAHCNQKPPGSSKSYNSLSLGLCLIGYFYPPQNHQPTTEQLEEGARWVADRVKAGDLTAAVLTHTSGLNSTGWFGHWETGAATACPGTLLGDGHLAYMMAMAADLAGSPVVPEPKPPQPQPQPPSTGGTLGPFPLPSGEWYGPDDHTDDSHSGIRSADRPNIQKVQSRLIQLGYGLPRYGADGWYGSETQTAVSLFQTGEGIGVDGLTGPQTWGRL